MATAPIPFFPTTVVPPPPCGCGAPAYAPCSFPPVVAYPSTPFSGGYHPSPFPFYSNPPAAPYVATYPCTAACPAPAYGPSSFGPAASSSPAAQPAPNQEHFRPSWCSPSHPIPLIPTAPNQEHQPPHPPITIPTPGYYSSTFPYDSSCQMREASQIPTHVDPNWSPAAPTPVHGDHHHHHHSSPECHAATRVGSSAAPLLELPDAHPVLPDYTSQGGNITKSNGAGSASISDEKFVHKHTGPGTLPMVNASPNHRLFMGDDAAVQAVADERVPAKNAIRHRRQCKLLNLHARLDEQQARERTSINTLQGQLAKLKVMASQLAISIGKHASSVHASDTEQSQDPIVENPSSQACLTTIAQPSATPVSASLVVTSTASVAREMFGEMPQSYGFHNLNTQSVIRADGTEHNYYALPEKYPSARATPQPVFALYDEESDGGCNESVHVFTDTEQQTYEEEKRESFQSPKCFSKTTFSVEKPTDTVGIFSLKNDARACNCSVLKASNSVATRSSQLSIEHCKKESRLLWDPGASAFLMTPLDDGSSNDRIGNEHVGHLVSSLGELSFHNIPPAKPPESEEFPAMQAIQISCFLLEAIQSWQRGAFSLGNFARSALWRNLTLAGDKIFEDQHSLDSSMKKDTIFSSGRMLPWNPRYILLLHYFSWEFSMGMMLDKSAVPNLVYSDHTTFKQPIFVGQPVDLKQFWALISLLQSHSWYNTSTAFLQVHYCCLPVVLDCPYAETVMQLACCSRMVSSTVAILSAICMSSAITVRAIVVLRSGKIVQEGKDAADLYQAFKIRLPMSNTSQIWDPGNESILFLYKGLHVHMIQQISSWTSMASNGITSYVCTMDFINDQWKFIHQQGFHENYNTKSLLLPSQKYLQIWKMDVMFITFLPP